MSNGETTTAAPKPKFKIYKRGDGSTCEELGPDGVCVAYISQDYLEEIILDIDMKDRVGNVTFVPHAGKPIKADLAYTILPQGRWVFKHVPRKTRGGSGWDLEFVDGKTEWKSHVKQIKYLVRDGRDLQLVTPYHTSLESYQLVYDLFLTSIGREVVYTVNYYFGEKEVTSTVSKQGLPERLFLRRRRHAFAIPRRLYIKRNLNYLGNPWFALIYFWMLEHFAGLNVPYEYVKDGLTLEEFSEVQNLKSKNPNLDSTKIAYLTTQAISDYLTTMGLEEADLTAEHFESMTLMIETIINQTKLNNPLGINNLMQIGKGWTVFQTSPNQSKNQIGIIIYGRGRFLLYNEFGYPVWDFVVTADPYHRSVDIGILDSDLNTLKGGELGTLHHMLWHSTGQPLTSAILLVESLFNYFDYIAEEISIRYGGQLFKAFMEMDKWVIVWFLAIGAVGVYATSGAPGNTIALAALVVFQWYGLAMDLITIQLLMDELKMASYHFCRMEEINRVGKNERGREKLTHLSQYHLDMGADYFVQALVRFSVEAAFEILSYPTGKAISKTTSFGIWAYNKFKTGGKGAYKLLVDGNGKAREIIPPKGKNNKLSGLSKKKLRKLLNHIDNSIGINKKGSTPKTLSETVDEFLKQLSKGKKGKSSKTDQKKGNRKKGKEKKRPRDSNRREQLNRRKRGQRAARKKKQDDLRRKAIERKEGKQKAAVGRGHRARGRSGRRLARRQKQIEEKQAQARAKARWVRPPSGGPTLGVLQGGRAHAPASHANKLKDYDYSKHRKVKVDNEGGEVFPAAHPMVTGITDEVLEVFIRLANDNDWVIILRTTNNRGVQFMGKGYRSKGKELIVINTDAETGKVTIKTPEWYVREKGKTLEEGQAIFEEHCKIAQDNGYYILKEDGFAHRTGRNGKDEVFIDPETDKPKKFNFREKGAHDELTNQPWQVIDPENGKAIIGDIDIQDIFHKDSPGRIFATAPESIYKNVDGLYVKELRDMVNAELRRLGYEKFVQHGADYHFMSYLHFRSESIKGDTIVILPRSIGKKGQVFHFTAEALKKYLFGLRRLRLEVDPRIGLTQYKSDSPE